MNFVKYVFNTSLKTMGDDIAKYIYLSKLCESNRKHCEDAFFVATNFCENEEDMKKDNNGCFIQSTENVADLYNYKCSKFSTSVPCNNKSCKYYQANNLLHKYFKEYEETKKLKQYFINKINERIK